MANYRQIHVSIWKDEWFLDLEPDEKLLFIYLFSNESTSLSGLYKLAMKVILFETGFDKTFVAKTLKKFEAAGKIFYRDGFVWVVNMSRYNKGSSKVQLRIIADINEVPDCELKRMYLEACRQSPPKPQPAPEPPQEDTEEVNDNGFLYPEDTLSIGYEYPIGTSPLNEMNINELNPVSNDTGDNSKIPKKTELTLKLEHLERVFCDVRGCGPPDWSKPKSVQKTWRTPLRAILKRCEDNLEMAEAVVRKTVNQMVDGKLTFSMPAQIEKTAESVIIDWSKGNGSIYDQGYTLVGDS
jgi:hypothetical protein